MTRTDAIGPGATLGVFGGGQLGRMFTHAAQRMGYRVIVFAPEPDGPACQAADEHFCRAYDDDEAVERFAAKSDAVTIEFENVPVRCLELAERHTMVRPGPHVLAIAQDRLAERAFLDQNDLPTAAHAAVDGPQALHRAMQQIGTPAVLKSARDGYDGRGQIRIDPTTDPDVAWHQLGVDHALYEAWIEYDMELSVLVARDARGRVETFGPIENDHTHHILNTSSVPARVSEDAARQAVALAERVATALDLEGLICVEMFLARSGELLINELAPRPHNSGHLTLEASTTSQFEQQVRVLAGLPLGRMSLRQPAAMVNLLGDLWEDGWPDWTPALAAPGVSLHLYGKPHARLGRKMGHLTATADSSSRARMTAIAARWASQRSARRHAWHSPRTPADYLP